MAESCTINERTSLILLCKFFDENNEPVTPESAYYRIDDERSGTLVHPRSLMNSITSETTVTITEDENRIINDAEGYEARIVTVDFYYSGTLRGTEEFKYRIKNLYALGTVASQSASPSLSPSASRSPSASVSPSISPSASVSASRSPSASLSPSISPSASASPSRSPSASVSPTPSASLSPSSSVSPS